MESIKIHGQEGAYFINKGTTTLIWNNGAYGFMLSGQNKVEAFVEIAKSVKY